MGPVRTFSLLAAAGVLFACLAVIAGTAPVARAAGCGDPITNNPFSTKPAASGGTVSGVAPFALTVTLEGVVSFPSDYAKGVFDWGDGSPAVAITATKCSATTAYWSQTLTHIYASAGTYSPAAHVTLRSGPYVLSAPTVLVNPDVIPGPIDTPTFIPPPLPTATPTPTATNTPTATPSPTPTSTRTPTPTATPTQTAPPAGTATPPPTIAAVGPGETPPAGSPTAASPSPSPSASPSVAASASPSPTATAAGTPSPQATSTAAAAVVVTGTPPPSDHPGPDDAEIIEAVKGANKVSIKPSVVATNLILAGLTVWVLFSSVIFNQVIQDNRDEIDEKTARFVAPLRRARQRIAAAIRTAEHRPLELFATGAAVLLVTGAIYSALDPGFGVNRRTVILFVSIVFGTGIVAYLCSSAEAWTTRRVLHAGAGVRAYPAAIAIAAVSVAFSRVIDFQPGVIYGFIASCTLLAPAEISRRQAGRIAATPSTVALVLAVGSWLLVEPLRSWHAASGGWFPAVLEASAVVVFIDGIEGLFVAMLPIAQLDGRKILDWSRGAWLFFALVASFLAWHVLIGRERAYFSGLREAKSLTIVIVFIVYTAITAGTWAYFRFHKAGEGEEAVAAAADAGASGAQG